MTRNPNDLVVSRGRRRFLAGAGGLLALPFLESIASPRRASAWSPAEGMPHRLMVFLNYHGLIMEEFVPVAGNEYGEILRPIEDAGLKSKTLVVTGVNSKVAWGHGGSPSLLTCAPVSEDPNRATSLSIDHHIARHMQDGGLPRRFDVGIHNRSVEADYGGRAGTNFWAGQDERIEAYVKPQLAYDAAFPGGVAMSGGTTTETTIDRAALRRRSVLDGVLRQFQSLNGRVSASDRDRLDRHAEKLREIERAIETMSTREVDLPPACDGGPDLDLGVATHRDIIDVQADILAHAMACNIADVGTFTHYDLQEPAWHYLGHPDIIPVFGGGNYHGAWHKASDDRVDQARRAFTPINATFGRVFARLMSRLDEIDEGDGTALDNTMLLWISDFGHGGGHNCNNLPVVLAGNAGGAALGRHVNYSETPADTRASPDQPGNNNLAVTMAQAFGIAGDRFGSYEDGRQPVQPGPLVL